jgi:hypothetical protein
VTREGRIGMRFFVFKIEYSHAFPRF